MPTRFNSLSYAGRPSQTRNRTDWELKFLSFTPAIVADTADQDTGLDIPARAIVKRVFLNVLTAEATGLTKTLTVKRNAVDISGALDCSAVAVTGPATTVASNPYDTTNAAQNLQYALGSNDWVEFDGEVIVEYLAPLDND